jgi:hypothetical protein
VASRHTSTRRPVFGRIAPLLVASGLGLLGLLGPRLMDGLAALDWTRYHVGRCPSARHPAEEAAKAARWSALAIDRLAPLPPAATAARLALDLGHSLAAKEPRAVQALCLQVRGALDGVAAQPLRGLGLGALAEEARALESATASRAQGEGQP